MKVILFGASGMVGQGVLRECLLDADVETVLLIGRSASGRREAKIREIVHKDIGDLGPIESALSGYDACFFCLGVSSVGMTEAEYRRVTWDLTIGAAGTLARLNPAMTFIYVSGAGTDSTERGRSMWARVKGATENALLRMPFQAAYMFRPAFIQPMHGEIAKAALTRIALRVVGPIIPLVMRFAPKYATTTERMGRAMLIARSDEMEKRLVSRGDEMEKRLVSRGDEMEERFNSHSDEMEKRLNSRSDEMEERFNARSDEMEKRLISRGDEMEERLKVHTSQECEKIETKLLTAFHKWGSTSDIRTRQALENVTAFNDRIVVVEDRVTALERKTAFN